MTRALRYIPAVLLLLLLGGSLNVSIAWFVSQSDSFVNEVQPKLIAPLSGPKWPRPVPDNWPRTPDGDQLHFRCLGNHFIATAGEPLWRWEEDDKLETPWSHPETLVVELLQVRCGWPALALERELRTEHVLMIGAHTGRVRTVPDSLWPGGITINGHRYPIRPLWPGFAINTLFYSAAAGALFLTLTTAARTIRRIRRKAADRCPACAYPRAGLPSSTPCPECGGAPAS